MKEHVLIGKIVRDVSLSDDQECIRFTCDGGEVIRADCYGDCCSHSWVEDILYPDVLIGVPVLEVENIDMPDGMPTKHGHFEEEMQYYGCKIRTSKGVCTIEYRNSSNGYYGGSLEWLAYGTPDLIVDFKSLTAEESI